MGKSDSLLSKTIAALRFPLIFVILYIHVVLGVWRDGSIAGADNLVAYEAVRFSFVEGVARVGVPLFFLISGFLFFYSTSSRGGFGVATYRRKLIRRTKTLVCPFIFWNLAIVAFYAMAQMFLPSLMSGNTKPVADFSFLDWLSCFYDFQGSGCPVNVPLWFVRDLIILVVVSPVLYFLIHRFSVIPVAIAFVLWLLFGKHTNIYVGVFFFSAGAWFGIKGIDFVSLFKKYHGYATLVFLPAMASGVSLLFFEVEWGVYFQKLGIMAGMVACVGWTAVLVENGRMLSKPILEDSSFLIYAYHNLPMLCLSKIIVKNLHPDSSIELIVIFILLPILIAAFGVVIYRILKKLFGRYSIFVCGK